MIDLHVHSTFSDGSFTPSELVELALKKNLTAFALTDHDTVDGISEAIESAADADIMVIPGIELSTSYKNKDIHILGLNIDYKDEHFLNSIAEFKDLRNKRNTKMIDLLKNQGFPISEKIISERFPDSVITRAHYATWLTENNYVASNDEAFKKYLSPGCPCYVAKTSLTPEKAIDIIHSAGGKAVLAHPLLYAFSSTELDNFVLMLAHNGLDGIEAIYSSNAWTDESHMKALADKYDLLISGGSDFHGTAKPDIELGTGRNNINVPDEILLSFMFYH